MLLFLGEFHCFTFSSLIFSTSSSLLLKFFSAFSVILFFSSMTFVWYFLGFLVFYLFVKILTLFIYLFLCSISVPITNALNSFSAKLFISVSLGFFFFQFFFPCVFKFETNFSVFSFFLTVSDSFSAFGSLCTL